jgi:hypothetical protein
VPIATMADLTASPTELSDIELNAPRTLRYSEAIRPYPASSTKPRRVEQEAYA